MGLVLLRVTDAIQLLQFCLAKSRQGGPRTALCYLQAAAGQPGSGLEWGDQGSRLCSAWWKFTRPLILVQYYLPVVAYLGLFLIQRWYGSVEQGYYALALQWCGFSMLFTNSGVWIFWREIAHNSVSQDRHVAAKSTSNSAPYSSFWH